MIVRAKQAGLQITCEVAPHHLFLTADTLKGGWFNVRPSLSTPDDCSALWENMQYIDIFATDHGIIKYFSIIYLNKYFSSSHTNRKGIRESTSWFPWTGNNVAIVVECRE